MLGTEKNAIEIDRHQTAPIFQRGIRGEGTSDVCASAVDIFDSRMAREYGFLDTPIGGVMPAWVPSAPTLAALAEKIGVAGPALEATVARWDSQVADGNDPDFRRGNARGHRRSSVLCAAT
jgi:hypothetical protein